MFLFHREKLNRKFFALTQEIDDKKLKDFILQKKLNAMPKWQKEDYIKKNPESLGKHKQLIHKLKTEERALHEAYQILLSEHHIRKKLRKRYLLSYLACCCILLINLVMAYSPNYN